MFFKKLFFLYCKCAQAKYNHEHLYYHMKNSPMSEAQKSAEHSHRVNRQLTSYLLSILIEYMKLDELGGGCTKGSKLDTLCN